MNPRHEPFLRRMEELIVEGEEVANLERPSQHMGRYIQDGVALQSWLTKAENVLCTVFGRDSTQFDRFKANSHRDIEQAYRVRQVVGVLVGAADDLRNGFLAHQEFIVAGAVFANVLDEARQLLRAGHKDVAAMLMRVALEDALRRLARRHGQDDAAKASAINNSLKAAGAYPQPQWRLNQACLDTGNDAAHGNFGAYTADDAGSRIDDVERFWATYCV